MVANDDMDFSVKWTILPCVRVSLLGHHSVMFSPVLADRIQRIYPTQCGEINTEYDFNGYNT